MASPKNPLPDRRWIDRSMAGVLLATLAGYGVLASGLVYLLINEDRDNDISRLQLTLWCGLGALAALAVGIACLRFARYRTLAVVVSSFFFLFVLTYSFLVEQKNGGEGNSLSPLPIAAWQPVVFLLIAASVAWCLRRAGQQATGRGKPGRKFAASAMVSAALMLFAAWIWAFGLGSSKPQQQTQASAPTTQEPTWENIRRVIATELNVPEEKVVPSARFDEDLNAAEPDLEEMVEKLQSTFGVDWERDDDDMLITVQDAVDYVRSPETFRSTHAGQSRYEIPEPYPEGLRFSKTHQWVKVEGREASIGMTRHAQQSVAFIGHVGWLPQIGQTVSAGKPYATVEEGMAGAVLLAPVSGVVTEVNEALTHSSKINKDPYGAWIIRVRLSNPNELNSLFSPAEYRGFVEAGH